MNESENAYPQRITIEPAYMAGAAPRIAWEVVTIDRTTGRELRKVAVGSADTYRAAAFAAVNAVLVLQ